MIEAESSSIQWTVYDFASWVKYVFFRYINYVYVCGFKIVSLKLEDSFFDETEEILSEIIKLLNKYINEVFEYYNKHQKQLMLEEQLKKEPGIVKEGSMVVLKDFKKVG